MFRRKWLASVVSVVMVFAFMPISSFALDDFGVQPAENTEVSVPDAEPEKAAPVEEVQKDEPAPADESTGTVDEESEIQESEASEDGQDDSVKDDSVKDDSEETEAMPAQEFNGTAGNGIKVYVSAPEGAFPEGTSMKLEGVSPTRALGLVEDLNEDIVDASGVDITFHKNGKEIQPKKAIKVSLSNANVEGETFNVYHVADNGAVDRVSGASSNGASFKASSFSIYIVGGTGESETPYTATYFFKNGDDVVDTQIIKNQETLKKPESPEKTGYKFIGWFNGDEEFTDFGQEMTVSENREVTLTARFQEAHYVFFKHPNGGIYTTKEGVSGETITTTDVVINIDATSSAYKWYTDSACSNQVTSVTLGDSNIYLYTKEESGHWITFDSNGGSFIESQFVNASDVTVKPADPSRMGYTFAGWKPNDPSFSFGSQLDKNVTLTASWTANSNTKYTVIHWQENANDDNYSFAKSEQKSGTTGADTEAIANSYSGFTAEEITQKTIAGDGSTIVNVYYKRNTYTLEFISYTCGKEEHTHSILCLWGVLCDMQEHIHTAECETIVKTITEKWGRNIEGLWPTGAWYVGSNTTVAQVWLETMPQENRTYYGPQTGDGVSKASYYVEPIAGDDIKEHHTDSSAGTGYTVTEEDRYNLTGYTFKEELRVGNETYKSTRIGANYNGAKFYYSRNSYDIVFINNGTTDKTVSKKYEASIAGEYYTPKRPASIPEEYTFGGWYDNELCEGDAYVFTGKTMPAGNITLYAKWTAPKYTAKIHVKVTDDTSEKYDISYGEKLNPDWLRIPYDIPEGSTFIGWGTQNSDGSMQLFDTNQRIYSNVELFPIVSDYSRTYSVVYDANGGTGKVTDSDKYLERSYAEVKSAKALTAPNGKVFLGWNTAANGTGTMYQTGDKIRIDRSDVTLYAQWGDKVAGTSIVYHSNYSDSDDKPFPQEIPKNNQKVYLYSIVDCRFTAPEGYKFKCWTNATGDKEYAAGQRVLVDNLPGNDLYAQWEKDEAATVEVGYTVKHVKEGETEAFKTVTSEKQSVWAGGEKKATVQAKDIAKETPAGYKFKSIDPAVEAGSKVANGTEITLTYEKDEAATVEVGYTVKHVKEGETEAFKTVTSAKQTVWAGGDKKAEVQASDIEKAAPEGYKFKAIDPPNVKAGDKVANGTVITLTYEKRTDLSYTVYYLEEGTNNVLIEAKTIEGQTFGSEVTEKAESIDGYTISGDDSQSIKIGVEKNEIVFYYTAVTTPPTPGTDPTPGDNGGNGGTTGGTPTATPAPATTAVAAAAPAPAADNTVQIEDQETPKANLDLEKDGAWALLNLLLSLLACIMSIALIITYFMKKREDEEEQNADYAASGDEEERKLKKKGLWRIISIAWAILMLIVFFLTEDMSLPMIWVDKWTILMVVMTIIQAGIMFMSRKKYEDEDEDNPQMA